AQKLSVKTTEKLEKTLANWNKPHVNAPGFILKIVRNGDGIFQQSYGYANLAKREEIDSQTIFRVASLSKQFTAACMLLLEEKGLINLDDPLSIYFPYFPDYASDIKIHHLIHHTSGVRDFFKLADLSGFNEEDFNSEEAVLKMIARQKKLIFTPGEEMLYNNSGYFLLARIVYEVTGMGINEFAQKYLFKPLGMQNTYFCDSETKQHLHKALGYSTGENESSFRLNESNLIISGDVGLFTTIDDLSKWDNNFYNNRLPVKDFTSRMYTKGKLNDGTELSYAFGLEHNELMGMNTIEHCGAYVGFKSAIIRIPQKNLSVFCLANLSDLQPEQMCRKVAEIILEDDFKGLVSEQTSKPLPFERRAISLPDNAFDVYSGKYELGNGQILQFYTENNRYYVDIIGQTVIELFPESVLRFFVKETDFSFSFVTDKEGNAVLAVLHINDKKLVAKRVENTTGMNEKQLDEYVGAYYNEELDVVYKLSIEDSRLFIRVGNKPQEQIGLIKKDKMILGEGLAQFRRDRSGKVAAFLLEAGSVKDLLFVKK
ncbi:MAG: serine hydrolase, partial [Bacteroidota bacterium]